MNRAAREYFESRRGIFHEPDRDMERYRLYQGFFHILEEMQDTVSRINEILDNLKEASSLADETGVPLSVK